MLGVEPQCLGDIAGAGIVQRALRRAVRVGVVGPQVSGHRMEFDELRESFESLRKLTLTTVSFCNRYPRRRIPASHGRRIVITRDARRAVCAWRSRN